jgi:hypothetical protein
MAAAASGHSTLGIPENVGEDFLQADKGHHFSDAMQAHGLSKRDGGHKRHPATSHYTLGQAGHRFQKRT